MDSYNNFIFIGLIILSLLYSYKYKYIYYSVKPKKTKKVRFTDPVVSSEMMIPSRDSLFFPY